MDGHLVHLAGQSIRAANVIRTRCAWCGALIEEADLDRMAYTGDENPFVKDDGTPHDRWQGLVAIADGNPRVMWAVDDPADGKIPEDSCMALDPVATS